MTALDKIKAAHLRTSGRPLTGRGPYSGFCPCHHDRKPSLTVTEAADRVLVYCHAGCPTETILGVWGLEMGDLYETRFRRSEGLCEGYFDGDCMRLSEGIAVGETRDTTNTNNQDDLDGFTGDLRTKPISGALYEQTFAWVQTLPEGSRRAGWYRVLDEWTSLTYYVNERVARLSRRDGLDIPTITFAAGEAAVKVFEKGTWDRGEAKLTTYCKRAIRQAVKDETARQLKSLEPKGLEWDGPVEGGREPQPAETMVEIPPDTYQLEPGDRVPTCLECGKLFQARKRADAEYCTRACQQRAYRNRQDYNPSSIAEALEKHYSRLVLSPIPARGELEIERRYLRFAVEYVKQQHRSIRRLEQIIRAGPDHPAYRMEAEQLEVNNHDYWKAMSRSPYEENGSARWSQTARTLANRSALVVTEYVEDEDITDDRKGEDHDDSSGRLPE